MGQVMKLKLLMCNGVKDTDLYVLLLLANFCYVICNDVIMGELVIDRSETTSLHWRSHRDRSQSALVGRLSYSVE